MCLMSVAKLGIHKSGKIVEETINSFGQSTEPRLVISNDNKESSLNKLAKFLMAWLLKKVSQKKTTLRLSLAGNFVNKNAIGMKLPTCSCSS